MSGRFVGRVQQLAELSEILEREGTAVITQVVAGLGGIGKTELACEYARRGSRDEWVLPSESVIVQRASLVELGERLRSSAGAPPFDAGQPADEKIEWVIEWLRSRDGWLLIHDNVEERDVAADLIDRIGGHGRHLITTRRPGGWQSEQVLTLGKLGPDEAGELLLRRTGRQSDEDRRQALALNEAIDGVPQLLVQAAGVCVQEKISFARYLQKLRAAPKERMARRREDDLPASRAWDQVWAVSLEAISRVRPPALLVLGVAGWLAPDGFPRALVADIEGVDVDACLGVLNDYSMLTLTTDRVEVHRTVQQFARLDDGCGIPASARLAEQLIRGAISGLDFLNPGHWSRYRQVTPSAMAWRDAEGDDPHRDARASLALDGHISGFLFHEGDARGSASLLLQALEQSERVLGPEHPDTLSTKGNLAQTLSAQGDLAGARTLQEQVVEQSEQILGPEHGETLICKNNLAQTLRAQGDLVGARTLQEQVVEGLEGVLGPKHPDTLMSKGNLGSALYAQGDLVGARTLQEQVVEGLEGVLGPEHPDTLTSNSNLASTLAEQGDLVGARTLQEQVVEQREQILGPEHPDTLSTKDNLASTLAEQGDLVGARTLQEQVVEQREQILGPEHPDTLITKNNLASTLAKQGDLVGARTLQEQVVDGLEGALGPEHPTTIIAKRNLVGMTPTK